MSRLFTDVLAEISGGLAVEDATDKLDMLVKGVLGAERAGTLTLKLKVTPNGLGSVKIDCSISASVPDKVRGSTIMFNDEKGGLVRDNPRQLDMFKPTLVSSDG